MKKTIFGSALIICGMIAKCTEYLEQKILFAAPNVTTIGENYLLSWGGRILIAVGLVLCIKSLLKKKNDEE